MLTCVDLNVDLFLQNADSCRPETLTGVDLGGYVDLLPT